MFQNETETEHHLERSTPLPLQPPSQDTDVQRKRMLVALGILLVALVAVVLKDWDFWFPPSGEEQEATVRNKSKSKAPAIANAPEASPRERKPVKSASVPAAAPA